MTDCPLAFISYVRDDSRHDGEWVTKFRDRLSGELKAQGTAEFEIFQDHDIKWGEQWKDRLVASLNSVTFLIPILTPNYFRRDACRWELQLFLQRERTTKRNDLILPVYYIGCKTLEDPSLERVLNFWECGDRVADVEPQSVSD